MEFSQKWLITIFAFGFAFFKNTELSHSIFLEPKPYDYDWNLYKFTGSDLRYKIAISYVQDR